MDSDLDVSLRDPRFAAILAQTDLGFTIVRKRSFLDEDVYLDGRAFEACSFRKCRIYVEFGAFSLVENTFDSCEWKYGGWAAGVVALLSQGAPMPERDG